LPLSRLRKLNRRVALQRIVRTVVLIGRAQAPALTGQQPLHIRVPLRLVVEVGVALHLLHLLLQALEQLPVDAPGR
jgi:hypothetical protein